MYIVISFYITTSPPEQNRTSFIIIFLYDPYSSKPIRKRKKKKKGNLTDAERNYILLNDPLRCQLYGAMLTSQCKIKFLKITLSVGAKFNCLSYGCFFTFL